MRRLAARELAFVSFKTGIVSSELAENSHENKALGELNIWWNTIERASYYLANLCEAVW